MGDAPLKQAVPRPSADALAGFKQAARRFASGVTVVTTRHGDNVYGLTVSAFSSLSVDPLLILVSVRNANALKEMALASKIFAVNILREEQRTVSQYFSISGRAPCPAEFPDIPCFAAVTGAPVIEGSLAYFDCHLEAAYPGGDHTILVGSVAAAEASEGAPLLYFDGAYRALKDVEPEIS